MGDYSVKAILSAADKGFTSTMKGAQRTLASFGSTVKNGLGMGVLMGVGQQAFTSITGSVKGLISETMQTSDAMAKLKQAMEFSGQYKGMKEIEQITGGLKDYADKTVFELQDVMSTFGALSANGIKDADKMTQSVGNAVAVFGGGAREFSSVGLAFSQAMASGALHAQDWNQILNASPQLAGGLRKELIKLNPAIGKDFKGAMEKGMISADLLGQAMNNIGMTEFAKEAAQSTSTFEGAMGNMKASAVNGMMSIYEAFAKSNVVGAINKFNGALDRGFSWLSSKIPGFIQKVSPYWKAFSKEFVSVAKEFGSAFSAIGREFKKLTGAFGSTESVSNFKDLIGKVGDALKTFAGFLESHADKVAKFITLLPKLWLAFQGFKIVNAVAPGLTMFAKGLTNLAGKGIAGLAGKLFGISKGQKEVGSASMVSGQQTLTAAKSFAIMGGAVLLVAAGFALLAFSSIALANAGGLAIGVMVGMVAAVVGLGIGMAMLLKFLAPMSAQLIPAATAMLLLGAAVVVVAAGFAILAATAIMLSNAGGLAIGIMAGLVLALAGLMALAAYLAPMLTAGAVGFLALGAAILMAGVAALLVSVAIALISTTLPIVAQYGLQASVAFLALGASLMVFGAGALVAGAGALVLGAGLLVVGVAVLACAVGMAALAAGTLVLGAALLLCATSVTLMASMFPMAASGAMALTVAFTTLLAMSVAFGAASLVVMAGMLALTAGAVAGTASIVAFGLGMTAACVGVVAMAAALKAVKSSMKSIASSAKTTKKSLSSMTDSVKFVSSGLDALGNKAKSAMNKLTSAFSNAASKAKTSGKQLGSGFTSGMQSGLVSAPVVAMATTSAVSGVLRSGRSAAYSAGAYISQGFAQGMRSQLAVVRSAAAQLAAAADKAVRAKAKIHSPSKVADKLGGYWVAGFANSLVDGAREVWKAAENLVSIPTMDVPEMRLAYAGELSSDYEYYRNAEYTVIVPVEIDGKEFARVTAPYTEAEQNKRQKHEDRKRGRV